MQSSGNHQRARSAGSFPVSETPSTRRHGSHRSVSSVPQLPSLQLPQEGLGFPGIPTTTTRQTTSRNAPVLPPLNLPGQILEVPGVHAPQPTWTVPLFDDQREPHATQETNQNEARRERPAGLIGKFMELLGYTGRDARGRRALVSLVFSLFWWFAQFVVVIALLAYSGSHESPTTPGETEWAACDRPLGIWNALWIVKVSMSSLLSVWNWQRERVGMAMRERRRNNNGDTELATQRVLNGQPHYAPGQRITSRQQAGRSLEGTSGTNSRADNNQLPPQTRLHARFSLITSFLTLAWFLTAQVLEYTSVHTCRLAAPHLWWLTFGILCTLYIMILEIFLLGLLVFILGPVLFLMYNILLLCLGRHPLQNPHYIKPDIDKLPKSVVDQIPLVLYIPQPPGESTDTSAPITAPPAAHSYPPKSPAPSPSVPKRRFAFFRRKNPKKASSPNAGSSGSKPDPSKEKDIDTTGGDEVDDDEDVPWDEMWEKGEYPFVRLEGNRAVCAICLMDFEEPKRIRGKKAKSASADADAGGGPSSLSPAAEESGAHGEATTQEIQVEEVTEEERDALKLNDAGEGPQPLRLLACGHVFHRTCLDPWLTDVSGRCPICQRPVELPQPSKKRKRRQRG